MLTFKYATETNHVLPCPEIGLKCLLFLFSDLGAVLRFAALSCFFAVAALLEPAEVPQTTKLQVTSASCGFRSEAVVVPWF